MQETISVSSRLGRLLDDRAMSVAELQRRLHDRFGLAVDPKTLYRLTRDEVVQRADLNVAAAVGTILGVGLDDLFDIRVLSDEHDNRTTREIDPDKIRRLSDLFRLQADRSLSSNEEAELQTLLADYTRAQIESTLQGIAHERGIPYESVYREFLAEFETTRRREKSRRPRADSRLKSKTETARFTHGAT